MKKLLTGIMVLAMVGIATADVSIVWKQKNSYIGNQANTEALTEGYAQLLWSPTAPTAPATIADPNLLAAGEYLLDDITISDVGLHFEQSGALFSDSDVGGNAVVNGVFYTRIFDAPDKASVAEGTWYVQNATTGPGLATYDPQDTATVYSDNVFSVAGNYPVDTQVVPEPATVSLMALIAGFGFLIRRHFVA